MCKFCAVGELKEQIAVLCEAESQRRLESGGAPLLTVPVEGSTATVCAVDVAAVLPPGALAELDGWLLGAAEASRAAGGVDLTGSKVAQACARLEACFAPEEVTGGKNKQSAGKAATGASPRSQAKGKGKEKSKPGVAAGGKGKGKLPPALEALHGMFPPEMFFGGYGDGNGADPTDGTGYGGSSRETCMGSSATKKAAERAQREQNNRDKDAARACNALAKALESSPAASEWRGELAHYEAACFRQRAVPALSYLLANDSLMDLSAGRRDALIATLRVVSAACASDVHVRAVACAVARPGEAEDALGRALLEHLRSLSAAAKVVRDNSAAAAADKSLMALMEPAASAAGVAEAPERRWRDGGALGPEPPAGGRRKRKRRDNDSRDEAYKEALAPQQFLQQPLLRGHAFQAELQVRRGGGGGGASDQERKRQARLAKEVASLATGLPLTKSSSIFLRVDESRLDCMRALILPSPDTPYAFGFFEFDIMLPADYPHAPPKVRLLTTGGGRWRPNPNLYADGKVCLSLLGTWEGPRWDPKFSTILQVLISIQSLIFVVDPYFNEPGFEEAAHTSHGMAEGKAYTRAQRVSSMRHAVLPALRSPPRHFEAVVKEHARRNYADMRRTFSKWRAEAITAAREESTRRGGRYDPMAALLGEGGRFGASEGQLAEQIDQLDREIASALDAYIQ